MTSPTHESTTTTDNTGSSTAHSFDLPATVDTGDHLLAVCSFGDDDITAGSSLDSWTLVYSNSINVFFGWRVYWLRADGTEDGGTIDFTTVAAVESGACVLRVSGTWGSGGEGTAYDVSSATSVGYGTGPNPNQVTASWGAADNLVVAMTVAGGLDPTISSYPASYSSGAQSDGSHIAGAAVRSVSTAAEDPGPFTLDTTTNHQTLSMIIRPASIAGDTTVTAATAATAFTEVTEAGDTTVTAATAASGVVGSVGQGDTTVTAASSAAAALSMTGDTTVMVASTCTAFTRNRGVVLVTQGEQALLAGTWSTQVASSCRLFVSDPSAALTDAGRNALTEDDFTEPSFTGYAAQSLTSGNWTVAAGEPSDMTHTQVTFTCSSGPGSPEEVDGYYVTRDSDGLLIWFDVFTDGPSTIAETSDSIAFQPKVTIS